MDVLSKVIDVARLRAGVFSRAALQGAFRLRSTGSEDAMYHVVVRGNGELRVGGSSTRFRPGDLILIPHGAPHMLCAGDGGADIVLQEPQDPQSAEDVRFLQVGDQGEEVRLLSGTFTLHHAARAFVLESLDPFVVVHPRQMVAAWLDHALGTLAGGGESPLGAVGVTRRLAEVLVMRLLTELALAGQGRGWLAALGDETLVPALNALHAEPEASWTAQDLAERAGLDRASLNSRFRKTTGFTTMEYLRAWRMVVAQVALSEGSSIDEAAYRAGYTSRKTFSRAFQRHTGTTPVVFARQEDRRRGREPLAN